MDSQAPPPSLPACQSVSLAEQLQAFVARLGSTEIQSLLASIKECDPKVLFNLFVATLKNPPERNLDTVLNEFDSQFQDLKLLLLGQKPSEVTPPPSPPDSPREEKPIVLIDGLAVFKPTFDAVQRHLAAKSASRFNLDSEIPLNTRMLLIVLHGGYLSDAGLFVQRVPQRMRDILAKFRVQCQTNEQLRFVSSPSAFADHVCIVEMPAVDVAPEPMSEPRSEQFPTVFVAVQNWSTPPPTPKQENRLQARKFSRTAQGDRWKFCMACNRQLQSSVSEAKHLGVEAIQGRVQPKAKRNLKRRATGVECDSWKSKRPKMAKYGDNDDIEML